MTDSLGANEVPNQSDCSESYNDYLLRAVQACESGDLVLGMHLYLAAYEKAVADPEIPDGMALAGLREAWNLACDLKERSMAEYVFEKLEPFLTADEIAHCASKLQNLALDRLEEYGFSREELQDMAEMISQDFLDGEGSIVKVESISIPRGTEPDSSSVDNWPLNTAGAYAEESEGDMFFDEDEGVEGFAGVDGYEDFDDDGDDDVVDQAEVPFDEHLTEPHMPAQIAKTEDRPQQTGISIAIFNPYEMYDTSSVGKSYHAATNEGTGAYVFSRDKDRLAQGQEAMANDAKAQDSDEEVEAAKRVDETLDAPVEDKAESDAPTLADAEAAVQEVVAALESASQPEAPEVVEPVDAVEAVEETEPDGKAAQSEDASASVEHVGPKNVIAPPGVRLSDMQKGELPQMPAMPPVESPALNFHTLSGYDETISIVREFGIGLKRDASFTNFVKMMNSRHGLDRMPAVDTLLFRSPAIEDATRFVEATIGEIGLPVLRMSMEEGMQGMPMLCVTTQGNSRPRMNHAHNRFAAPGILVVEDLDMWSFPQPPEGTEGIASLMMANMSRGAREAIGLIRSAVEDPDVYVLATATTTGEIDPFFYEMLEPLTVIDIPYPTEHERERIWREIMRNHPSTRKLKRADLVRFSAGMPRYDLYMAARAAIEEAYKMGLSHRMYLPVTMQNMLDKLAACLPLDSEEYRVVEGEIVRAFRDSIDDLEGLLDAPAEQD